MVAFAAAAAPFAASGGIGLSSVLGGLTSLGNVGSALGGLGSALGIGGRQKRGPDMDDMLAYEGRSILTRTAKTMEAAEKYGVHPMYLLGSPALSSGGVSISGGSSGSSSMDRLAAGGQDISRAASALMPDALRRQSQFDALALERGTLENELLRSQINRVNAQSAPGLPLSVASGTHPEAGAIYNPTQLNARFDAGREGGSPASWTEITNRDGSKTVLPSADFQDRAEEIPLLGWEWLLRNRIFPNTDRLFQSRPAGTRKYRYGRGSQ